MAWTHQGVQYSRFEEGDLAKRYVRMLGKYRLSFSDAVTDERMYPLRRRHGETDNERNGEPLGELRSSVTSVLI